MIILAPCRVEPRFVESINALLTRADLLTVDGSRDQGLYGDLFDMRPANWPAAALTRQLDAGDAVGHAWLRVDPAYFRVEPGNVRLLACGDIGQRAEEAEQLHAALAPVFGDEGFELSAPHPHRWYVRAFAANAAPDLPDLPPPEAALGGDLFELWREDAVHRRWRRLLNEAQIVLAHHPVNRQRSRHRQPPINGVWFWGAGRFPDAVRTSLTHIVTADALLAALGHAAGIDIDLYRADALSGAEHVLIDLRARQDEAVLAHILAEWQAGRIGMIEWRTVEHRYRLKRWHRWRFWR